MEQEKQTKLEQDDDDDDDGQVNSSGDENEDFDEYLDWRAKRSHK